MKEEIIAYAPMDRSNRITIPKKTREIFDLRENDQVFWKWHNGYIIFGKVEISIKEKPDKI